jgi:hypothetical protein
MAGWRSPLLPFLLAAGLSPFLLRKRVDRLGSQAREAAGELGAFAVDSVQGLGEIVAFQQESRRGDQLNELSQRHIDLRLPFFRELTLQHAILEVLIGLGGLAVVVTGAVLVGQRRDRSRPAALAHHPRHGGLPAGVGDRPDRPPARRHAGRDAPRLCAGQRADPGARRPGAPLRKVPRRSRSRGVASPIQARRGRACPGELRHSRRQDGGAWSAPRARARRRRRNC